VKLADGRSLRARVVGADAATDIALIKVESDAPLPTAPLGDSASLRVGEWVCAIGNPLAYEHTVTVGVVSYLGRKLFDASLDDYIQTDAAINFGNSGGPLINARGEVIGINAAISWRASSIGFAIPINMARSILPQLRAQGRVSRGYVGITLKALDPDLRQSLRLGNVEGALVQDVAAGSPGDRAGIRPYDVITSVDGEAVRTNEDLIRRIAMRTPGAQARLEIVRDGRAQFVNVRLAERPSDDDTVLPVATPPAVQPGSGRPGAPTPAATLGLALREVDRGTIRRLELPATVHGIYVTAVEPLSNAAAAGFAEGDIILEVNRQPVSGLREFARAAGPLSEGSVVVFLCYVPDLDQRVLRTIRIETSHS
jgi:serine protease Do